MNRIKAGRLNKQLIIQIATPVQDGELNVTETWSDWKTVAAESLSKTSREFYRLANNNSEITRVFRTRFFLGVTARQKIKFGHELLEIVGSPENEDEKNESLLIACKGMV